MAFKHVADPRILSTRAVECEFTTERAHALRVGLVEVSDGSSLCPREGERSPSPRSGSIVRRHSEAASTFGRPTLISREKPEEAARARSTSRKVSGEPVESCLDNVENGTGLPSQHRNIRMGDVLAVCGRNTFH